MGGFCNNHAENYFDRFLHVFFLLFNHAMYFHRVRNMHRHRSVLATCTIDMHLPGEEKTSRFLGMAEVGGCNHVTTGRRLVFSL